MSAAQLQLFDAARESADRWAVRVSRRARRLSVRVYPGGRVEVVAPPGASAASVQRFVGVHREWINRRIEDLSAAPGAADEDRPAAIDLPAIGRRLIVCYQERASAVMQVQFEAGADVLVLHGPVRSDSAVAGALRAWFMKFAAAELTRELTHEACRGGFQFKRIQVRRQRTRWGSCSATGTISLNACVLFLEPAVMRYLLVHELSHTRHMNHSRRFWSLVAAQEPDYRRLDRELMRGWRCVPGWVFG